MQYKHSAPKNDANKTYKTTGIVILILLIIALAVIIFKSCSDSQTTDTPDETTPGTFQLDPGAVIGGWDEADVDKIVEGLNEKVEEGMINISMNTSPVFTNSTSTGNFMIVNESVNRYPQVVEITRNDTGESIYKSAGIPVGNKIENAKLSVDLPAGTYECTAMFHNVDSETGVSLGCAGAIIYVTVLE